jgi:drug/metabolite transporter (DMT)-like permease
MVFWQGLMQKHAVMTLRPNASADVDARQRFKAIGLMALATLCFAALDSTGKYLIVKEAIPVAQVTWLRFLGHVVFSAVALWPFAVKPSLRSAKPVLQILRSALMVVTTGFNFLALRYLQLDQTITIFFLTPLLVAALAGPLLHEWVGWHRVVAIAAGFIGVLLVVHPGIGTVHWAMLLALVATFGYALYNLATRYLAGFDPPEVTQTYTPLGGVLILAHRSAPAPVLAPFIYLGLLWMSVAGYLIFDNVPTLWTLSGAAVVILSGLYLLARERKAVGAAKSGPAADIATQ